MNTVKKEICAATTAIGANFIWDALKKNVHAHTSSSEKNPKETADTWAVVISLVWSALESAIFKEKIVF